MSIGYLVKKLWLKERLTKLQAGFLYLVRIEGSIFGIDLTKKELRLQYLIHEDLRGRLHIKQKLSPPLVKGLYWKSYGPLSFATHAANGRRADRTFLTYIQQQLFYRHPKWLASVKNLYAGHHLMELGLIFILFGRPILHRTFALN